MKNTKRKGFTIVELVIVIAVIAILAAVLIPTFSNVTQKAEDTALQESLRGAAIEYATKYADRTGYVAPDKLIYKYEGNYYELDTATGKYEKMVPAPTPDDDDAIGHDDYVEKKFNATGEGYETNKFYTYNSTYSISTEAFNATTTYYEKLVHDTFTGGIIIYKNVLLG